jgi:hypothetical protein
MDITAIGIAIGLAAAVAYASLRAWAKLPFELGHTVLVFLSSFSVPGGIALISAGIMGKPAELPSSWREHVSVAGIVAIGLAVHYVVNAFRTCWATRQKAVTSRGQPPGTGTTPP